MAENSCHRVFEKGVLQLDYNPTQIHVDTIGDEQVLVTPSFFNVVKNPQTREFEGEYTDRDKVAIIRNLQQVDYDNFDPVRDAPVVTDVKLGRSSREFGTVNWPNDSRIADEGVFPFNALVMPQGFHPALKGPGRLSAVNLDDPNKTEYIIHESRQNGPFARPLDPENSPRFYHEVYFHDMDGDGYKDIVTSRSGFRVAPQGFHPPFGELLWFKNPGKDLKPDQPWQETIIWGGPPAQFKGPDVDIALADIDEDGVVEIIATSFYANQTISIFAPPKGGSWADVDALQGKLPRYAVISDDQGSPLGVEVVDLNMDGRLDILATNHQPDNCGEKTASDIPGRVYALEMPADGKLFESPWTTHILKDNIRPQPTPDPIGAPGRLAPGAAIAFHPVRFLKGWTKPRIVVGGDEAGKAWVLRPNSLFDSDDWSYQSDVIFDINDYYGERTTQTYRESPAAITYSTVGSVSVGYDRDSPWGVAEIYIPVFEAQAIHVFSYRKDGDRQRVSCGSEALLACSAANNP